MKLYVLRHEERPSNPSFDTELTAIGHERSKNSLLKKLVEIGITEVYTSPFIRTLQTVQSFCDEVSIYPKVDYSLYETLENDVFIDEANRRQLSNIEHIMYSTDSSYVPVLDHITYPETRKDITNRVSTFLTHIMNKHSNTTDIVLLCTHGDIVNTIYDCFKREKEDYPMGKLTLIYCT